MRTIFQSTMATGLLLAATVAGARAQEAGAVHPRLTPARDVTVTYSVQTQAQTQAPGAPAGPQQVIVAFAKDGDRLHIEPADRIGATILDRPGQTVTLVMNKQKLYVQFSPRSGLRNPFLLDLSMHFTPAGTGEVAGLACQKWTIATQRGNATACVTEDGVILSESGVDSEGTQGQLTALNVQYGPIDPSLFLPPAGYQKVTGHMPVGAHRAATGQP
jgi:hypothetical protein